MEEQEVNTGETAKFFSQINSPFRMRLYLLANLPAAFFSGLSVVLATKRSCTVSVPYKNFTKNPFRSTYFACLSMAAELSTGVLAMANVYNRRPPVRLLITGMEARFYKKATGKTFFTCMDGHKISTTVAAAIDTGQGQEVEVHSVGRNEAGDMVADFWFTWSFKQKT